MTKLGRWVVLASLFSLGCSDGTSQQPVTSDAGTMDVALDAADDAQTKVDTAPTPDVPTRRFEALPPLSDAPVRGFLSAPDEMLDPALDYRAEMVTTAGTIHLDLYEIETPTTVNSFVFLARHRFFEGIAFHRVIEGFVAQAGDPNTVSGDPSTWGRGGPGYAFGLEVYDELRFDKPGVLGMARSASPNSNGSQFYLTLAATPNLIGLYTVFGGVLGPDDLAVLAIIKRGEPPVGPTRIERVTIFAAPRL